MKVSDYIVQFLIDQGITDVFGYPGGMVTHLMDSFSKREKDIHAHVTYHEQGAAFAACGYAQITGKPGVAYATSGPGATNLITGICNAYFDSIPTLFITGQVNRNESKQDYGVRQRGFQETDIVSMVRGVTQYAAYVDCTEDIRLHLEKGFALALAGRPGPVLLDIPMDVFRSEMDEHKLTGYTSKKKHHEVEIEKIFQELDRAKRPCLLVGAGVKGEKARELFRLFAQKAGLPVVSSMLAVDVLPAGNERYFGFLGAYGDRCANFILAKSDCILALGCRMDVRQVGGKRDHFAPDAKLIRVDIDLGELSYSVKPEEIHIQADVCDVLEHLNAADSHWELKDWLRVCNELRQALHGIDERNPNLLMKAISQVVPDGVTVVTDVGQNQVWAAQSFLIKPHQRVLFSGGHGAMGYSLPAAIGAYYGTGKPVVSINGDGGLQMNIQELQSIARERLPITIVVMNNFALGMIRHFQEMYFDGNYTQTVAGHGYAPPNFCAVAKAYGLDYRQIRTVDEVSDQLISQDGPRMVEVVLDEDTYVFPKLEFGKPNQDQQPLIDRQLYQRLMEL